MGSISDFYCGKESAQERAERPEQFDYVAGQPGVFFAKNETV